MIDVLDLRPDSIGQVPKTVHLQKAFQNPGIWPTLEANAVSESDPIAWITGAGFETCQLVEQKPTVG